MTIPYLIIVAAFAIVATYISVVRHFLNESEREDSPPRKDSPPSHAAVVVGAHPVAQH